MTIIIKKSKVTIQEVANPSVSAANILRTSYEKLISHEGQPDESAGKIRQIIQQEMKAAVQKAARL